ncbi:hypothetical protein ACI2L1_42345 [Streptomyces sp. NPDC019531]|uniref:hypothetical protein n=1 Tax=Streptomyces sp. NPDC019531 TaxID=3365062 RepID=UPI00384D0066
MNHPRREGGFGNRVAGLDPDVVVDLVCFTPGSATALVERLPGEVGDLVHCGTAWRYGPADRLPISETTGTPPSNERSSAGMRRPRRWSR